MHALTIYRELYQTQTIKLGSDHPDTLNTRNNLASCLQDKGDVDGALTIYRELYQTQTIKLGSDHPHTLTTRHNLARCLQAKVMLMTH